MHRNQRRPFTAQENNFIRESVKLIGEEWEIISKILPGRTPKQIHDRYQNYLRDGLKKEPWTKDEDKKVIALYEEIGPKWTQMVDKLPGRSPNDIKNRWHKHLVKTNPCMINNNHLFEKPKDENIFLEKNDEIDRINANDNLVDLFNSVIIKDDYDPDEFKDSDLFDNFPMLF